VQQLRKRECPREAVQWAPEGPPAVPTPATEEAALWVRMPVQEESVEVLAPGESKWERVERRQAPTQA
jgi:hypothetical protein